MSSQGPRPAGAGQPKIEIRSPNQSTAPAKLLGEFSTVGYEDWRKLVELELKGAPFEKKMVTPTAEGIKLRPIYRREDVTGLAHVNSFPGFAPFVRGSRAAGYVLQPWNISQEIAFSSAREFNHAARNSTGRGLTALNMVLDQATRDGHDPDCASPEQVGFGGLSVASLDDLDQALEGIDVENTSLFIRSGASAMPFAALLVGLARRRKKTPAALRGCIEMDPLGVLAHQGKLPQSLEGAYREMVVLTRWAIEHAPHLQTICVHSRAWHESGANAVQELAFTLATGVEYLRAANQRDLPVDKVAPRMRFAVTVGVSFFMEIAKLRALRMLWARVVATLGGREASQALALHVRTSQWNKTVYDPYNNVLRATVEAFAGVLGSCDSMQVGAFDEVLRRPDDFSRRIARNTQLVLQKECHLDHVIDPAGGCWYIEALTAELAERAWAMFQEVEKLGGMEAAMRADFPQKAVGASAAEKIKGANRRRDSIIGVNQYANPSQLPLQAPAEDARAFHKRRVQQVASHRTSLEEDQSEIVLEKLAKVVEAKAGELFEACVQAVSAGATLGEITRAVRINDSPSAPITPVCVTRVAASLEHLRAATDRFLAGGRERPKVFLLNMGPLKEHKARADFSRGFMSVAGYDVISPPGFRTVEEAVDAFVKSGAKIGVLCSTDDKYPALVTPLVQGIRAKHSGAIIVLAGYPQDQVEAHKKAGIHEFIHFRADAMDVLASFHKTLGIEP
jgi:methylmalonyl-CoA mutase